jgi:hypothetical protein
MNATLREPFYLIPKDNQLFSYTKFPVNKIIGWRGGVLSLHPSTASGMVMQWPGWRHDGGDGRTGPMATKVIAPTGLMSHHRPVPAWSSCVSPL